MYLPIKEQWYGGMGKGEIRKLIEPYSPRTFIELGANNGSDTSSLLGQLGLEDRYIAVEADPRCVEKHKSRINDKRLTLIHAALNDHDGTGTFHMCTSPYANYGPWDCASSLRKPKQALVVNPWLRYEEDVEVRFITLDTLYSEYDLNIVDFVWCDVEGAFADVIRGGSDALKKTRFIYSEVEEDEQYEGQTLFPEVVKMMEVEGWELVFKFRYDALFRNKSLTESIEI